MNILLLDNYDSFTYNLVHYLEHLGARVDVFRNDEIEVEDIQKYDRIILSPGPGTPDQAGILKDVIRAYASSKPILGICLGQQAIAEVFGATLIQLDEVTHGITTPVEVMVDDEVLFKDLPYNFEVGRYHSWVVNPMNFPDVLEVTAIDAKGTIMALRHKVYPVKAVQFHPESIMTPLGMKMLENWLNT
jgi:anthranilate synthase component 2